MEGPALHWMRWLRQHTVDISWLQLTQEPLHCYGGHMSANPYERLPEKNSVDFIRKTMQMHEDTFKQQVIHQDSSVILIQESNEETEELEEADAETCGRRHITAVSTAIDDERAAEARSFIPLKGNYKMSIHGPDRESEAELTLSIGGSSSKKTIMSTNQELGFSEQMHKRMKKLDSPSSIKSGKGGDCSTLTTPMSSSSATFDNERKKPHWLFQGLRLNMTV
ncbi:uncharacterized protein LOC110663931 [Hevea brasiliensis]|uniref:uncharacterized protein LOC110663931 n=1 Tax=Hevea brasiliensis TaxID=3981 RepID=UPI0025CCBD76|nr:uncharacterized protein LOC110663931 [Hevea brasiliensis]